MKFTGKNLVMIQRGIDLVLSELQNQIGTCPDVVEYADDIEQLEAEIAQFQRLANRVDAVLENAP